MKNDFRADLKYSHSQSDAPWWREVYTSAFPNLQSMTDVRADGWAQRGGIDRVLILSSGKRVDIDEKVRRSSWPDVLLERWSDADRKKPGWVQKDLACDFIAYAWETRQECLLLPFLTLRKVWLENGRDWIERYKTIRAENRSYTTESIAVPTETLVSAIAESMLVSWQ